MKFTIVRSKFLEGLKAVQGIVAGKGSLPVLQNVLLEANGENLTMTTTDLDISIKSTVECTTLEEGMSTLPVKFLFSSISKVAEGNVESSKIPIILSIEIFIYANFIKAVIPPTE